MTKKESNVLKYLIENNHSSTRSSTHGRMLTEIIFDEETIKRYSHARTRKVVIDTMTHSYLGKMQKKGYINISYENIKHSDGTSYTYYNGVSYTDFGKSEYMKSIK